ncbi:hypothetical protein [Nocardia wallacei]|uniref:hypothetical protein n=1 Tax=Nocardia wallacei TaxID=480035 RepID=UPI002455E111|nr:hypothetical protein [Nocardia wallacei]
MVADVEVVSDAGEGGLSEQEAARMARLLGPEASEELRETAGLVPRRQSERVTSTDWSKAFRITGATARALLEADGHGPIQRIDRGW